MRVTPLESDIEMAIIQAFQLKHHIVLFKTDAGGAGYRHAMRSGAHGHAGLPVGFPDLLGCDPVSGRLIAIECKRPGRTPTDEQAEFLTLFRQWNAIAFWADSVDSALQQFETTRKEVA